MNVMGRSVGLRDGKHDSEHFTTPSNCVVRAAAHNVPEHSRKMNIIIHQRSRTLHNKAKSSELNGPDHVPVL